MATDRVVQWNVSVSEEADRELREFFETGGLDAASIPAFIEDAVRDQIFRKTVQAIKRRNAATPPEELQAEIDSAVAEVRREMAASA